MRTRLALIVPLCLWCACGGTEAPPPVPTVHFSSLVVQPHHAAAQISFSTQEQVQPGLEVVSPAGKILRRLETSLIGTRHSLLLDGLATGEVYRVRPIGTRLDGALGRGTTREVQTLPPASGQGDEFASANIDLERWQLQDVHGFGRARHVTQGDERLLELRVPGSLPYQNWTTGDQSLALLENVIDEDLWLEFRSLGSNGPNNTGHGLLIEEGPGTWLRFEFITVNQRTHLFVAGFRFGQSVLQDSLALPQAIHSGNLDLWMRVIRENDTWTQEWSLDGETFTVGHSFDFSILVRRMGPAVAHSGGHASPFRARFDWVRTQGKQPDMDPDLDPTEDACVPWCPRADAWTVSSDTVGLRFETDEAVTALVEVGTSLSSFESLGSLTPDADGFLLLSGLQAGTLLHLRAQLIDASGNATWSPPLSASTPQPQSSSTPRMSLWEGLEESEGIWAMTSGELGDPQSVWNLRGSLVGMPQSSEVSEVDLTARLDGGPWISLGLGEDPLENYLPKRLTHHWDFNVELDVNALEDGLPLDGQLLHLVELQASLAGGDSVRAMAYLAHTPSVSWQLPVSLDFTSATGSGPVPGVGLVDGRWQHVPHGLLGHALCNDPDSLGYQRMITLGEGHGPQSWQDYLVELTLVVDALDANPPQEGAPFLGIGARWRGHSQLGSLEQPAENPHPMGGLFALHWSGETPYWSLTTEETQPVVEWSNGPAISMGVSMHIKLQCESQLDGSCLYSLKVWPAGSVEPGEWDLVHATTDKGQTSGAFVLIAHHICLALGEVVVTEL